MSQYADPCPHCKFDLDGGDIFEYFSSRCETLDRALEVAQQYGWTSRLPVRFSKVVGISEDFLSDVTGWECPQCRGKLERT